jgi:hypothetical protein
MLYAGLDLSRKRLDFHLLDADGATVDVGASPPDAEGLSRLWDRRAFRDRPDKGISGGYEDDRDYGNLIICAGHAGRVPDGSQVADQQ